MTRTRPNRLHTFSDAVPLRPGARPLVVVSVLPVVGGILSWKSPRFRKRPVSFRFQVFLSRPEIIELPLAKAGVVLVLAGVAFKVGAFPFNVWIPDVYQGAPAPTTAFLAVGSKAAGVFALIALTALDNAPFSGTESLLRNILIPVAGLTLLLGNVSALGQQNTKRLLGLSGISHAGFLLLGIIAAILHATIGAVILLVLIKVIKRA